jgi:hypothetical protein
MIAVSSTCDISRATDTVLRWKTMLVLCGLHSFRLIIGLRGLQLSKMRTSGLAWILEQKLQSNSFGTLEGTHALRASLLPASPSDVLSAMSRLIMSELLSEPD